MENQVLNIDLHMLLVLEEIFKTGSLSRTADRLQVSQPAISMALAKLRKHFDDQLFVRVGNEMRPTPQADAIRAGVLSSIAALKEMMTCRVTFDPATTDRTFRVALSDIGQIVMAADLMSAMSRIAPNARIDFAALSDRTPQLLQNGEVDLAVGFTPHMAEGFHQRILYEDNFICLVRKGHPRVSKTLTVPMFEAEAHVVVLSSTTSHLVQDKVLEKRKIQRRTVVHIPTFHLLPLLISTSDCLATLPRRAGLAMARREHASIVAKPPPFEIPDYSVSQYWHDRQARDEGNRWLRELIEALFKV
jgi:DNA-binding transcriptional LysR family regulator